jgi:hypothetical protein
MTNAPVTPEARVLDRGWRPRTSGLEGAIQRRESLRAAIADLRQYAAGADRSAVETAIAEGDRAAVFAAINRLAAAEWLDNNCQREFTPLHEWSAAAEMALLVAINLNADVILNDPPPLPDGGYLISEAELATATSMHRVGPNGQPLRARVGTPSLARTLVAR